MPVMSLIARLFLNKKDFDQGLKDAVGTSNKFADDFSKKLGKAFTGGAVAAAMISIGRNALDSAEQVEALATKLNITAEEAHKLFLGDKLGGPVQSGIFFNKGDLENLNIAKRTWIAIGDAVGTALVKLATWRGIGGSGVGSSLIGNIAANAKNLFGVSGAPAGLPPSQLFMQAKKQRAEEVGDILEMEQKAAEITAQNEYNKLTNAQKYNRLINQRSDVLRFIRTQEALGPLDLQSSTDLASAKLRAAQLQTDIQALQPHNPSIMASPLAGAFVGGFNPTQNVGRDALTELRKIVNELKRGITVKDVAP